LISAARSLRRDKVANAGEPVRFVADGGFTGYSFDMVANQVMNLDEVFNK
jgi:hypothetical protein